jgi:hypothetical protein
MTISFMKLTEFFCNNFQALIAGERQHKKSPYIFNKADQSLDRRVSLFKPFYKQKDLPVL